MKLLQFRYLIIVLILCFSAGCANVVPPSGGVKDVTPPKLVSINPKDSLLNTKVTKIDMRFDEFVTVSDVGKEIQFSPLLALPPNVVATGRRVTLQIPDSLLSDSTTYRVTFGSAIKDLHEGNAFSGYSYIFSTGSYFDSLQLKGFVFKAATGMADSGVQVVLYSAKKSDSAIVKEKPLYATTVGADGLFSLQGLPKRSFRIYAIRDLNGNLVYDGGDEEVAFIDSIVVPVDTIINPIVLNTFKEVIDTTLAADTLLKDSTIMRRDTVKKSTGGLSKLQRRRLSATGEGFLYNVPVDTTDIRKRTLDITKPINILFSKEVDTFNKERIFLTYDSLGIDVESDFSIDYDTQSRETLKLTANWKENTVYTLRLLKGFAKDSAGTDVLPSKHIFRTKSDEDYSRLNVHLPSRYYGNAYVLMVTTGSDTVYSKPVADTMVHLVKLQPGDYRLKVIVDKNKNGKWDTGDLLKGIQPEEVIPYMMPVQLKAGWDNAIDFEKEEKKKPAFALPTPKKRDKAPVRK